MKNTPLLLFLLLSSFVTAQTSSLRTTFITPPDSVRPGVYWYFMDGNISKEGMRKDLQSMQKAGIGSVLFLEVNVGIPRGKVDFLSPEWKSLFAYAIDQSEQLGIDVTLGVGPGWTGSGGPWVEAENSMRHLVGSSVTVNGNKKIQQITLPIPAPRNPFFGEGGLTPEVRKQWSEYYKDVEVVAFPTPKSDKRLAWSDEKALYYRAPYSSMNGVKTHLNQIDTAELYPDAYIKANEVIVLSSLLNSDGILEWKVPQGDWTIIRMGMRSNGAITRPAPYPGLGLECDKFDTLSFKKHYDTFIGSLLKETNHQPDQVKNKKGGLKRLHMDSWEMGAQNWSDSFAQEFKKRRGYDPTLYLPAYYGYIIDSEEISNRFLWDVRLTSQELVIENHASYIKELGSRQGLQLSIEPYDMNPTADLSLGSVADVQMCEFWHTGLGYNTSFSVIEATSIAHTLGKPVVAAEAFTSNWGAEGYIAHPNSMKNQTDWAFAAGINKFYFHTYSHQPLSDDLKPGMTMGGYGVHWDRHQTWWPMVDSYHQYLTRCGHILQQGNTVADILFLAPEGAPFVFKAPASALSGTDDMPDRKGYNFDACTPEALINMARVVNGKIVLGNGTNYSILVLPNLSTMTPALLKKVGELVDNGACVMGNPPTQSPGLEGYPACDQEVTTLSTSIWKKKNVISTPSLYSVSSDLYPHYDTMATILGKQGLLPDFESDAQVRYTHRSTPSLDIYFVSNTTDQSQKAVCLMRSLAPAVEVWDPLTAKQFKATTQIQGERTRVELDLAPFQSMFIVFDNLKGSVSEEPVKIFSKKVEMPLEKGWKVSFPIPNADAITITMDTLSNWADNANEHIKYFSGIATYETTFKIKKLAGSYCLDLGEVKNMARIYLNDHLVTTLWTTPWSTDLTPFVRKGTNTIRIEVANLWVNRLIGDEFKPYDGIVNGKFPDWLLNGTPRTSGRVSFTTQSFYKTTSPLLPSGLLGPIVITQYYK